MRSDPLAIPTVPVRSIATEAPAASEPVDRQRLVESVHVAVPGTTGVRAVAVKPTGTRSFISQPEAVPGPLFVTTTRKIAEVPCWKGPALVSCLVIFRSYGESMLTQIPIGYTELKMVLACRRPW